MVHTKLAGFVTFWVGSTLCLVYLTTMLVVSGVIHWGEHSVTTIGWGCFILIFYADVTYRVHLRSSREGRRGGTITPRGSRSKPGALVGAGLGLYRILHTDFREHRKAEVQLPRTRNSGSPTSENSSTRTLVNKCFVWPVEAEKRSRQNRTRQRRPVSSQPALRWPRHRPRGSRALGAPHPSRRPQRLQRE
jgi:hypothetical protein